ncbi:MAG: hypothetical protein KY439_11030 [Actinobacteria bacterium]|nr:hypothetical protein [Actinomycetota bacterium]
MSLNFNLLVETDASLGSVAETVLGPGPVLDSSTGAYRGRLGDHVELSVSESRPHRWDPVVAELGIDYRVQGYFTLNKLAPISPQTAAIIAASERLRTRHGGTGALLFERDIVVLRWSDGQLVVNDSEFKDTALAVVGSAALVGRIPWV